MGFLSMIGAVSAEENARQVKAARDEEAQTIESLKSQLAEENRKVVDAGTKLTKANVEIERLTRGWNKCGDDLKKVRSQLEASEAELATFRAARDRDNELRRQRRAKVKPAEPAKAVAKAKPAKKVAGK